MNWYADNMPCIFVNSEFIGPWRVEKDARNRVVAMQRTDIWLIMRLVANKN